MAFPDVARLLVLWLRPLRAEPVRVDVPANRPDAFTQIRRIGGPAVPPVVDRPNVDIRCWAPTAQAAMTNLSEIRAMLWALSGTTDLGPAVYDVAEMMGPRQDNDPESGQPFAMMTMSMAVRADAAFQWTN